MPFEFDDAFQLGDRMRNLRYIPLIPLIVVLTVPLYWCWQSAVQNRAGTATVDEQRVAILNGLRDEINALYGYRYGTPRINLGPCGRFAKAFREQWNARFPESINIAFVMANDGSECRHVLVRLPDGSYYDGGNGVMSKRQLLKLCRDSWIEEMNEFDLKLLDQRSYGLLRDYPICPNYSDEATSRLIESWLAKLPGVVDQP